MSQPLPPARHEALRNYFMTVVKDLVARGIIRKQKGQPLDAIIRAEAATVVKEVAADFAQAGAVMGVDFAQSLGAFVHSNVDSLLGAGVRTLFSLGKKR